MSSKHLAEKGPVLIRPLVLKLPIDFHCGGLWGSDLLWFLAPTKAKLSHLEAGSAFRDSGSAPTPPANLFPSGGTFFCRVAPQWTWCWRSWHTIFLFLPSVSTEFGSHPLALLQFYIRLLTLTQLHCNNSTAFFFFALSFVLGESWRNSTCSRLSNLSALCCWNERSGWTMHERGKQPSARIWRNAHATHMQPCMHKVISCMTHIILICHDASNNSYCNVYSVSQDLFVSEVFWCLEKQPKGH